MKQPVPDRIMKKINSQAGETIAEVLVALLISSVALVMLAGMIASTTNLVTRSKSKMEAYYKANERLEKQDETADVSFSIQISDEDNTVISVQTVNIPGFKNEVLGKPVYAYGKTPTVNNGD